jgi:hypothetical protein
MSDLNRAGAGAHGKAGHPNLPCLVDEAGSLRTVAAMLENNATDRTDETAALSEAVGISEAVLASRDAGLDATTVAVGRAMAKMVRYYGGADGLRADAILGGNGEQVVQVVRTLDLTGDVSAGLRLAPIVRQLPASRVSGVREARPHWVSREVGGKETVATPGEVVLHVLAGELLDVEAVVQFTATRPGGFGDPAELTIAVRAEDLEDAVAWLESFVGELERENPLRGEVIEVRDRSGGDIRVVPRPEASLDDVVVPAAVRAEIDRNVLGHLAHADVLSRAKLGSHRGVLLYGPPGTGKTSLVRGAIAAAGPGVTVLVPNVQVVLGGLEMLYVAAAKLAPAIVVLEDIDVAARDRHSGGGVALLSFLSALDGVLVDHSAAVVTIATTNDPSGIDEAAKRPGRIDRFVEVPSPDVAARVAILKQNLGRLAEAGCRVTASDECVRGLAAGAKEASGAVLREIVRRALLLADTDAPVVGDEELTGAAAEVGVQPDSQFVPGQYL